MRAPATSKTTNRLGRLVALLPYAWLVVFFLLPFLIVLKISVSQSTLTSPPYAPLIDPSAGWAGLRETCWRETRAMFLRRLCLVAA